MRNTYLSIYYVAASGVSGRCTCAPHKWSQIKDDDDDDDYDNVHHSLYIYLYLADSFLWPVSMVISYYYSFKKIKEKVNITFLFSIAIITIIQINRGRIIKSANDKYNV
ncbi:hypothetical protein J3Q64DRAFT_1744412 [Phycomyces blakesleeanus]|uniref:Uncharacterized protein n=1 Tax=Phycomyces blakesleeanus TaxID=4837 RepID=A0ABR3B189_PHYBL